MDSKRCVESINRYVPVIMLTARAGDADRLKGFAGGADDYVTNPFHPDELAARISAVLRRSSGAAPVGGRTLLRYPGLEIDLERRRVLVSNQAVRLSRTEWKLLAQLADNAGRVMLHGELLTRIWGPEFRDEAHYLRTWVSRLRAKVGTDPATPDLITTFPGIDYHFKFPPSTDETGDQIQSMSRQFGTTPSTFQRRVCVARSTNVVESPSASLMPCECTA